MKKDGEEDETGVGSQLTRSLLLLIQGRNLPSGAKGLTKDDGGSDEHSHEAVERSEPAKEERKANQSKLERRENGSDRWNAPWVDDNSASREDLQIRNGEEE